MVSAFSLALMFACNSEPSEPAPTPIVAAPESAEVEEPSSPPKEAQSVIEIPRPRFHARHILVAHTEASAAPESVNRTRDEAAAEAARLLNELKQGGDFEALARTHSDDGSGKRGGDLGVFTKGVMSANFEAATAALDIGALSDVVETPFGFHIIERLPVIEVHLAHILVQWQGLKRTRSERTREEASARIAQAQALLESGAAFDAVAIEWSDGPFGARGGDLGWFQKGQMTPQFDQAAFALKPGERSAIVESTHGFHLIQRIE